jgi:hypothetical protein
MDTYIQAAVAAVGVACLVWSVISYFRIAKFLQRCTETRGEVIRLERTQGTRGYDYAPVFSFQTASGESITVTSDISSSPADFTEGDSVRVQYDPANPSDAKIHSFLQTWGDCVIPAAVGVILLDVIAFQAPLVLSLAQAALCAVLSTPVYDGFTVDDFTS